MKNKKMLIITLSIFILIAVSSNVLIFAKNYIPLKGKLFGFVYDDDAMKKTYVSPINKAWGKLIHIEKMPDRMEEWTFDNKNSVVRIILKIGEKSNSTEYIKIYNIINIKKSTKD
jgi:hypothetical protein